MEHVFARSERPLFEMVDGEVVMVDVERGAYFALDPVGSRIWALLEEPQNIDALCLALTAEFEVAPDECRREVAAFLRQLEDVQLVVCR